MNTFVSLLVRDMFKEDVVLALDAAEAVYRRSQTMPDESGLTVAQVDAIRRYTGEAYRALSNARHVFTDAENDTARATR